MTIENEYLQEKRPLNQVQYASKDFPSYFDGLLARLKDEYGDIYNDYASSSLGVMFVNVAAYALSQLAWYLDRQASDTYLSTTRTLGAATRLALQVGYKPKPAASASVDLTLTFAATAGDAIIPRGFRFKGPGELEYQATADVLVPAGSVSASVNATESAQRELSFASSGLVNQRFSLTGVVEGSVHVADTSVRTYVNGLEWEEKSFITFDKTNQFEVSYTSEPPFVQFGDAQAGNIPSSGAAILIQYKLIHGSIGNVKSGSITKALDTFMVAGSTHAIATVTNLEGASGGSDPESLLSVKRNAPLVFQSRKSAITQKDYDALVNAFTDPTFGSVSKGYAAVVRQTSTDSTTIALIDAFLDALAAFRVLADPQLDLIDTQAQSISSSFNKLDLAIAGYLTSLTDAIALVSTASSTLSTAYGSANTAIGTLNLVKTELEATTGATVADDARISSAKSMVTDAINALSGFTATEQIVQGSLDEINEDITSVNNALGVDEPTLGMSVQLFTKTAVAQVAQFSSMSESISGYENTMASDLNLAKEALVAYLSTLFSADCKANVVKVPILVLGQDGFYTGPSAGLVNSVQAYLDGVKDVTHQVSVVSGASSLVAAQISISVKLSSAFVESELRANIESGIDSLLRGRNFDTSLYLSDLYDVLEPIEGIVHANITIAGPTDNLDAQGNLIVGELEIVTKGSVTITAE